MSKSNGLSGFALIMTLASAASAAAAAEPRRVPSKIGETLKQISQAYERQDCDTVIRLGAPIIDSPRGTGLTAELDSSLTDLVVSCEWQKDMDDRAYAHALRATASEEASDFLWRARFGLESDDKNYRAAVATIEAMSQGRGAALNSVPVRWIWELHNGMEESGDKDLRRRLLAVLASDAYAPTELYGETDAFRFEYAKMLAEGGDRAGASAIVAGLGSPSLLASAMLDPNLRPFVPATLDLRAAAEARLARNRELMARHPDRLDPLIDVAADLRRLGRPSEALDLLKSVLGRIDQPDSFTDRDDKLNWYWDSLGRTHAMLGHYDEMAAYFARGAQVGEGDNPNVSQVINLAHAQNSFGRGEDSLRTLAAFADGRKSSPYGEMEMRLARVCAYAVAGRKAEAASDLAYAQAHEKDHPEALADMLLCLGDMDGAAAAFIRRLEDPKRRVDALLQLSDYDEPPVALPPDPVYAPLAILKQRPDVRAAIERAGGIRRFRLQRDEL